MTEPSAEPNDNPRTMWNLGLDGPRPVEVSRTTAKSVWITGDTDRRGRPVHASRTGWRGPFFDTWTEARDRAVALEEGRLRRVELEVLFSKRRLGRILAWEEPEGNDG